MKLQYKPNIADDVLASYCATMIAGNVILRDYHSRLKDKYASRAAFRGAIFHKVDQGKSVRFGKVTIRKADLEQILAVRAIEVALLEAFAGVVYQMAKDWYVDGSSRTMEDMQQEAVATLLDSIYYYADPRVKFITFATESIKNTMISYTNSGEIIALPDSTNNRDLMRRYGEACTELAERASFDAVCDHMGLSFDERDHLRDILSASTASQSDVESSNHDNDAANDFTAVARPMPVAPSQRRPGYYRHSGGDDNLEVSDADMDMLLALRKLIAHADRLPEFDRAVLFAAMDGEYGWQAEVASRFTNKVSGKPYTRASVRWVMKRLGEMIQSIARGDEDALVSEVA